MRIVNWNFARHAPDTWQAGELITRIKSAEPVIVCATECHRTSLDALGGHVLTDRGVLWGGETDSECKVALWSAAPWTDQLPLTGLSELGGALLARTETMLGPMQVIGVCMPYHMAWPREAGMDERPPPWSQHLTFLDRLKPVVEALDHDIPAIIVGDFNQFIPLNWGSWDAHHALNRTLKGFHVVTGGAIQPIDEQTIDHLAVSSHLRASSVDGLSRYTDDQRLISDHFGVSVRLSAGGVRIFD